MHNNHFLKVGEIPTHEGPKPQKDDEVMAVDVVKDHQNDREKPASESEKASSPIRIDLQSLPPPGSPASLDNKKVDVPLETPPATTIPPPTPPKPKFTMSNSPLKQQQLKKEQKHKSQQQHQDQQQLQQQQQASGRRKKAPPPPPTTQKQDLGARSKSGESSVSTSKRLKSDESTGNTFLSYKVKVSTRASPRPG